MIYQGQEWEQIAALTAETQILAAERDVFKGTCDRALKANKVLTAERDALKAENGQLRELMNCYNVGGWTDSLTLIKERDAFRARVQELEIWLAAAEAK